MNTEERTFDPYRHPVHVPKFSSQFGGLWTNLSNAAELLNGKLALGEITEEEAVLLSGFIEDGYVILRGAVPHSAIAELNADIERVTNECPPAAWVDCMEDGRSTVRNLKTSDAGAHDKMLKLLDLYAFLPSARRIIFASQTLRFLQLIFGQPALVFQSLFFYKGSQQPVHRDTAFVRVSSPLEFAASWTALEDIQEGSGELVYYRGSQNYPEYLFEDKHKWMPPGSSELNAFYAHLNHHSAESGNRRKLLTNKGDTLIWSADLAHGGGEIDDAEKTRRSLVAHYCPLGAHPMYRYYEGASETFQHAPGAYYCSAKRRFWQAGIG